MTRHDDGRAWHTSSYSSAEGRCVEVSEGSSVLVRDTQNRALGSIEYPAAAWTTFLRGLNWHTSSYSSAEGRCVEVAEGASVLVRDTQNRPLGHIEYSAEAWTTFLRGVKRPRG
jgi:hypothetical protein